MGLPLRELTALWPVKQVEGPVIPWHPNVDTCIHKPREARGRGAAFDHRPAHPPTKRWPLSFTCLCITGRWGWTRLLLQPILWSPTIMNFKNLVSLQTILELTLYYPHFTDAESRFRDIQTHATFNSHSWWEGMPVFHCIIVCLEYLCLLLCKRLAASLISWE